MSLAERMNQLLMVQAILSKANTLTWVVLPHPTVWAA